MSIFRYNVFILDPENRLIDHNGEVGYGDFVIWNDSWIVISLTDSEIIIHLDNANTHRRYFLTKCVRPDDWREVDNRILSRCFTMLKYACCHRSTFRKNKTFLIIRNQRVRSVFEQLSKNARSRYRHIWFPDMIAPGYVAVTLP